MYITYFFLLHWFWNACHIIFETKVPIQHIFLAAHKAHNTFHHCTPELLVGETTFARALGRVACRDMAQKYGGVGRGEIGGVKIVCWSTEKKGNRTETVLGSIKHEAAMAAAATWGDCVHYCVDASMASITILAEFASVVSNTENLT